MGFKLVCGFGPELVGPFTTMTCITVINNILTTRGPEPPSIQFCRPIYMYNLGEIKGFCTKTCNVRPSSNLFLCNNQGRIYHLAQCQAPCAQMVKHLFGLLLYLAGRCCENHQSTRGPTQCKSGLSNNMLVSRFNHL